MASLFAFGRAQLASVYRRNGAGRHARWWGGAVKAALPVTEGSLSAVIEHEIIPRLVASRPRRPVLAVAGAPGASIADADFEVFVPLALSAEADDLLDHAEGLIARGVSIDTLLVDLLAPTARILGEYWESGRCDFVDVTMGMWRLQEVVHELSARVPVTLPYGKGWRALFSPVPGDQHSFASVVLDEIFAREGWFTDRLGETTAPALLDKVAADWFDLIGLTIGCASHMAALPSFIAALRGVSVNPRLVVMVGGGIFVEAPSLAAEVGADGTAADARQAVNVASKLVSAVPRREAARG
ncbi:MAG: cobalamin-binding protein [Zymomonas sp.]|uniref:cobalamin B12-binding domain-containing protein n=1 Tax=Sphingomonas sp. TaxID=28214 RepID=UPI001D48B689|nr:cobalamin-binding protein [Zymomonas sp.]